MAKKIGSILDMSHEEWLHIRNNFIGGSEAAVCVDMNSWSDKLTLYCRKKEIIPPKEDNFFMKIGRDMENLVAKYFMEETGKKVKNDNGIWVHDEYSFMGADIDRVVVGENAGLECKTMNTFSSYDLSNGEIPPQYYWQCQHYMAVKNFDKMYLAIIKFGKGFYWFEVNRNNEDIKGLIEAEKDFWENYILKDIKPDIDGSESSIETLQTLYPHDNGETVILDDSNDFKIAERKEIDEAIKRLKNRKEELEAQIKNELKESTRGETNKFIVTWKSENRTKFDKKSLEKKYPEIYKEFVSKKPIRVLRIKEVKGE